MCTCAILYILNLSVQSDLTYPHTTVSMYVCGILWLYIVGPHSSPHVNVQSDLTYLHTSVLDESADQARELDK